MSSCGARWQHGLWVVVAVPIALIGLNSLAIRAETHDNAEDLVFVSQINAGAAGPGCNASSVVDVVSRKVLHRVPQRFQRMLNGGFAAKSDLSLVLVTGGKWAFSSPSYQYHLVALRPMNQGLKLWDDAVITGTHFAPGIGIAILPDDDTLIVETNDPGDGIPGKTSTTEAYLRKFSLSEISPQGSIGSEHGSFPISPTVQIHVSSVGYLVHVVSGSRPHGVTTLDARTMTESGERVFFPDDVADASPGMEVLSAVSGDGRYILARRVGHSDNTLSVADLVTRKSWLLPMPGYPCSSTEPNDCGGVAVSHAAQNHGILAVRGDEYVFTYRFDPPAALTRLGRVRVGSDQRFWRPPIAWSGDGSRIITAYRNSQPQEFAVIRVDDGGRSLSIEGRFSGCADRDGENIPWSIYTSNVGRVTLPTPTATVSLTSTSSPTGSPSNMPTASPSPTATTPPSRTPTPTASPTQTLTPEPLAPVYLPISLREEPCAPEHSTSDILLVLDRSSSMTGAKLDAAKAAAVAFLDGIRLPQDHVGVVAFNREAQLVAPLTGERAALEAALRSLQPEAGTRIDRGLEVAVGELAVGNARAGAGPVIVLLTDGRQEAEPQRAQTIAADARQSGVAVYVIGLGGAVDGSFLKQIAGRADRYVYAPGPEELAAIYADLARLIPCPAGYYWGGR